MQFEQPLIEGRLVRRYKRFLADVALQPGGEVVVAHCPNPGSMRTCMAEGGRVWLSRSDDPRRKLPYTWELAEVDGAMVCVNTARANAVVAEALASGVIAELRGFDQMRPEVRYGARSRVDFLLETGGRKCYVEVKSVTLRGGDRVGAFPDAVTARGTRHLEELMAMVADGHRAVMLFCCNRTDARAMRPADEIDPLYGRTLRRAAAAGVELLAYRCAVSPRGIWVEERVPVET
jgi:sugar fermentation stimulation protein A